MNQRPSLGVQTPVLGVTGSRRWAGLANSQIPGVHILHYPQQGLRETCGEVDELVLAAVGVLPLHVVELPVLVELDLIGIPDLLLLAVEVLPPAVVAKPLLAAIAAQHANAPLPAVEILRPDALVHVFVVFPVPLLRDALVPLSIVPLSIVPPPFLHSLPSAVLFCLPPYGATLRVPQPNLRKSRHIGADFEKKARCLGVGHGESVLSIEDQLLVAGPS